MSVDRDTGLPEWRHIVALAAGLLLAPFAAMLHLELGYAGVREACRSGSALRLHLESLLLLGLALAGVVTAGRIWRAAGGRWPSDAGDSAERDRFLGATGAVLSILFALVIVAQWLPVLQLDPCQ